MSELMKEMFRRLAVKSGYRRARARTRSKSRPRKRSPSAALDLTSKKSLTQLNQKVDTAPENFPKSSQEKTKGMVLPPEPDFRSANSNGIFSHRETPLEAPLASDNRVDMGKSRYRFLILDRKSPTSLFWSDLQNVLIVAVAVVLSSFLIASTFGYWDSRTKHAENLPIERDLLTGLNPHLQCERTFADPSSHENDITEVKHLEIRLPQSFEPEVGFDFSLSTLGAKVLTTRSTKELVETDANLFGYSVWKNFYADSQPDAPLQPILIPGRCWRFAAFPGTLVIRLAESVIVTSFSLSHILGASVPRHRLNSTPKDFEVWGLNQVNDLKPYLFGNYTFRLTGSSTQDFPVRNPSSSRFPIVELKILDNYGLDEYTCVYRFKVFGIPFDEE